MVHPLLFARGRGNRKFHNSICWAFPFSIFFMLCMGVWGVVNAIIVVKVFSPPFYKKAFKLLEELEKKGG